MLINPDPDRLVEIGELVVDVAAVSVRIRGRKQHLPWREFQLLLLLADNAGRVLSAETLRSHIWDEDFVDATGNLKAHISRLRKRMKEHLGVDYIRTVRGMGYVLEAPLQLHGAASGTEPARGGTDGARRGVGAAGAASPG